MSLLSPECTRIGEPGSIGRHFVSLNKWRILKNVEVVHQLDLRASIAERADGRRDWHTSIGNDGGSPEKSDNFKRCLEIGWII